MCESAFLFHFLGKYERGYIMIKDVELERDKLIEAVDEVSLETVLKGMNSHYFFDTLHAIKGCAVLDEKKTMDMINLLAKTVRQGVRILKDGKAYTTISRELEYVRLYLDIAQLHYGDMECEILNNSEDFSVPIFTLRHLAEEAFTRCMTVEPELRRLRVYTFSDSTHDYIEIKDSGKPLLEEDIRELMTRDPEKKRNEYFLYKKSGWRVEITNLLEEGNRVLLSRPRKK